MPSYMFAPRVWVFDFGFKIESSEVQVGRFGGEHVSLVQGFRFGFLFLRFGVSRVIVDRMWGLGCGVQGVGCQGQGIGRHTLTCVERGT